MGRFNVETAVGVFLVAGFLCFAWMAVRLGDVGFFQDQYTIQARFGSVAGLRPGAVVQIAGVNVGEVATITLDPEYYEAVVAMKLNGAVQVPDDSIASIRTTGIIGDRYVNITPGGSPDFLGPNGVITETESAISIEELIGKYIFQNQ